MPHARSACTSPAQGLRRAPERTASRGVLCCLALAFSLQAQAHGGHAGADSGLVAGFLHPLGGLDHLLVALGVGWLAGQRSDELPGATGAFLLALVLGAVLGGLTGSLVWAESCLAATCVLTGLLLMPSAGVAGGFATALGVITGLVHGHAHGAEGSTDPAYLSGLVVATLCLALLGAMLGRVAPATAAAGRGRATPRRLLAALLLTTGALAPWTS
jgi:urease accessory protein